MNKVFVVGRLASDPQQFVTQNGITQSRVSIATSDNWNKNETYFFPCVAWQSTANFINTYLKKGDLVAIDGKLIRRSYLSKEGKTVYVIEIVIESIKPFGSNKNYSKDQPSSLDEKIKVDFDNTIEPSSFSNNEMLKSNQENIVENKIENSNNNSLSITNIEEDLFDINDENGDDVVNLDWLKDFSS